jgi:hypothetical protein
LYCALGHMDAQFTQADFVRLALAEFPELRRAFEDDPELIHVQMHAFTQLAQSAKGAGDWETYSRCMRLAHQLWQRPDERLRNALNVSFLEHLDFDGSRGPEAWKYLTPALQEGWRAMRAYNEQIAAHFAPKRKQRRRSRGVGAGEGRHASRDWSRPRKVVVRTSCSARIVREYCLTCPGKADLSHIFARGLPEDGARVCIVEPYKSPIPTAFADKHRVNPRDGVPIHSIVREVRLSTDRPLGLAILAYPAVNASRFRRPRYRSVGPPR